MTGRRFSAHWQWKCFNVRFSLRENKGASILELGKSNLMCLVRFSEGKVFYGMVNQNSYLVAEGEKSWK